MKLQENKIISLSNVTVAYPDRLPVLSDVSLDVNVGDFIAVSGPNGGGKTTLLRVMLKLLKPTSGYVNYYEKGSVIKTLKIGYLPQKTMIDTRFPISVENVVKSGLLSGFGVRKHADVDLRLNEVSELMGLSEFRHKPIGELSGGQLQRTLFARALISHPEVLVLDEPLSYVDKHFEEEIYTIVEQLSSHATIILVSHEMTVISKMATRHIIVNKSVHECCGHHHYVATDCDV